MLGEAAARFGGERHATAGPRGAFVPERARPASAPRYTAPATSECDSENASGTSPTMVGSAEP